MDVYLIYIQMLLLLLVAAADTMASVHQTITVQAEEPVGFTLDPGSEVTFLVEDGSSSTSDGAAKEWHWLVVPCRRVTEQLPDEEDEDGSPAKGISLRWTSGSADTFQNGSALLVDAGATADISSEEWTALDDYVNVTRAYSIQQQLHLKSHLSVQALAFQLVVTLDRPYVVVAQSEATVHGVDPRSASLSFGHGRGGSGERTSASASAVDSGEDTEEDAQPQQQQHPGSTAYLLSTRGNHWTSGILCRLLMLRAVDEPSSSSRRSTLTSDTDTSLVPLLESGQDSNIHVRWSLHSPSAKSPLPSSSIPAPSIPSSASSSSSSASSSSTSFSSASSSHLYLTNLDPATHYSVVTLSKRDGGSSYVMSPVSFQTLQGISI